jgi:hypothetical protein
MAAALQTRYGRERTVAEVRMDLYIEPYREAQNGNPGSKWTSK